MTLRASVSAAGMRSLLGLRRETLQNQIRERFQQAREAHTTANVKDLSAALRQVKTQLAALH